MTLGYSSRVRPSLAILLLLPLAACSGSPTPKPAPKASRIEVKPAPPAPARPRWQAVPAKADGAPVPGGRRHLVKRGETGIAIAKAYGVPWSRIASANRLERDAILEIGQPLFIPTSPQPNPPQNSQPNPPLRPPQTASPASRPQTPEERAAAFTLDVDDLITGSAVARPSSPRAPAASKPRPEQPQPAQAAVPSLAWPVDGRVILSRFGPKPGGRVNDGVNIKAIRGQAVRAAADGEILYVGDAIAGFGLMMLVRHSGGTVTAYGHLEDALADKGSRVQRGQVIARAGSSGEAKEPQLLFQVRQGRKPLDPLLYLPR